MARQGNLDMGNVSKIINLPAPANDNDAARKVDIGSGSDNSLYLPGRFYASQNSGAITTQSVVANQIWAWPWTLNAAITIKTVRLEITLASAAGSARVGLWRALPNSLPGAIVPGIDVASYAGLTTGVKISPAMAVALTSGRYWWGVATNQNMQFRAITTATADCGILGFNSAMGTAPYNNMISSAFAFTSLPTPAPTAWANVLGSVPFVLFEV